MDLINEISNSINKYFSGLRHTGYKSYSEVEKLIVFIFIEELLYGPLSQYVTDEDYRTIDKSINCLYGTCMIPFPDYKKSFTPVSNSTFDKYRATETLSLKVSEDGVLRVKS